MISGTSSPGSPIQATMESTGTVSPSPTRTFRSVPVSKASTSMSDLSVSISKSASPFAMLSPSCLYHCRTVHSSVIWPGWGMRMGVAIR
jgi:hypothetical protein